jgi:hypothetical protein
MPFVSHYRALIKLHLLEIPFALRVKVVQWRSLTRSSGGAIGAGLFVGSGGAFTAGGPASVLLGFMIIGECWTIQPLLTTTRLIFS